MPEFLPSSGRTTAVPADIVDLAAAASSCRCVTQAISLAAWVGEGRRVTPKGVLRPADVPEAASALGIVAPRRIRTAADLPELHRPWRAGLALGLLALDGTRVVPRPAAGRRPAADPGSTLAGWMAALEAVCTDASGDEDAGSGLLLCRLALDQLNVTGQPVSVDALRPLMVEASQQLPTEEWLPWYKAFRPAVDQVGAAVDVLVSFGAISHRQGLAGITGLGRWLLTELLARRRVPVAPELPAADLLSQLAGLDEEKLFVVARDWMASREPGAAAQELLRAADTAPPAARLAALGLTGGLGEHVLPVLREAASGALANLAPHARVWLHLDELGPPPSTAEQRWIVADYAAAALATSGPGEALAALSDEMPGQDADAWLAELGATGHPDAAAVTGALNRLLADHPALAVPVIYQVRITLTGFRPPVWRQARLPATATLGTLHEVIRGLLGWGDGHLHMFTVGRRRYADPFFDLDALDENGIRLSEALPHPGGSIRYVYDLGDNWRHDITLESVLSAEPGVRYPVCVGGRGDAPVEDWAPDPDEELGSDSTPYDPDEINRQLAGFSTP
jgi:hypothetical protein